MDPLSSGGGREEVALQPPSDALLVGFPRTTLKPTKKLYRSHRRENGPWWFSYEESGRFDLSAPHGTCYLADDATAALREGLGRAAVSGVVDAAELEDRVVSTLVVAEPMSLADTTSARAANHGMTKEISTDTPYSRTQEWAAAWFLKGFLGIRYAGRFSTSHTSRCFALFGRAGAYSSAAVDPSPERAEAVAIRAGIRLTGRPTVVQIVPPPD